MPFFSQTDVPHASVMSNYRSRRKERLTEHFFEFYELLNHIEHCCECMLNMYNNCSHNAFTLRVT